jgi:hypothetical protein
LVRRRDINRLSSLPLLPLLSFVPLPLSRLRPRQHSLVSFGVPVQLQQLTHQRLEIRPSRGADARHARRRPDCRTPGPAGRRHAVVRAACARGVSRDLGTNLANWQLKKTRSVGVLQVSF